MGTVLNMLAITESEVHASSSIWTFRGSGFKTPDPNLLLVESLFRSVDAGCVLVL